MRLHRFTNLGIKRMSEFLHASETESSTPPSLSFLEDPAHAEAVAVSVEERPFARSFDFARYTYELVTKSGIREPASDKGLWSWLAAFWFGQLCRRNADGRFVPGESAHWIPALDDARRFYRHLVLGRYLIYAANIDNPERALAFLCQPIHTVGHIYYQLAARQRLITCKAVVEVTTMLYYDPKNDKLRRNAQTYGRPGSVFRLADVLMQLDRTFDLHSLNGAELLDLLPEEFEQYRMQHTKDGNKES